MLVLDLSNLLSDFYRRSTIMSPKNCIILTRTIHSVLDGVIKFNNVLSLPETICLLHQKTFLGFLHLNVLITRSI